MTAPISVFKRFIPVHIRRWAIDQLHDLALRRSLQELAALPENAIPDERLMERLSVGWANPGMVASSFFVSAVARYVAETRGPILECGSGLTTLVLRHMASRRGISCVTLEHMAPWAERIAALTRERSGLRVMVTPLRNYGEFSWYDVEPETVPAGIELVVCDGPPHTNSGGRYGLVPVLLERMSPTVTILLDDAQRQSEVEVVERWTRDWPFQAEIQGGPEGRAYAILRRRDFASPQPPSS